MEDGPLDLSAAKRPSVIKPPSGPAAEEADTTASALPTCSVPVITAAAFAPAAAAGPNRMSYPREFKLMVIDYFRRNGENKYRTCKEFKVSLPAFWPLGCAKEGGIGR